MGVRRVENPMSPADAGRRGGNTTFGKYGRGHYEELGRKVGEHLRDTRPGFHVSIAGKGGTETFQRYGPAHYSNMGKEGGAKLRNTKGREYYVQIGKKSSEMKKLRKIKLQTSESTEEH